MGNIKYGDIEYFTLEGLRDKLRAWKYDKLDLEYLDKLRMEIDIKIRAIHNEYTNRIKRHLEESRESNTILQD